MSYLFLSRRTAGYLAAKAGLDQEKEVVLAYIIEVLVINIGNLLLTLLLGMLLGVLPGTVACIAAAVLFRHTAGGAHSKSPWRCTAVTIVLFPAMALLASPFIYARADKYRYFISRCRPDWICFRYYHGSG